MLDTCVHDLQSFEVLQSIEDIAREGAEVVVVKPPELGVAIPMAVEGVGSILRRKHVIASRRTGPAVVWFVNV